MRLVRHSLLKHGAMLLARAIKASLHRDAFAVLGPSNHHYLHVGGVLLVQWVLRQLLVVNIVLVSADGRQGESAYRRIERLGDALVHGLEFEGVLPLLRWGVPLCQDLIELLGHGGVGLRGAFEGRWRLPIEDFPRGILRF